MIWLKKMLKRIKRGIKEREGQRLKFWGDERLKWEVESYIWRKRPSPLSTGEEQYPFLR